MIDSPVRVLNVDTQTLWSVHIALQAWACAIQQHSMYCNIRQPTSLYANLFFTLESSSSVISDVDKVLSAIWEFRGSVLLELKTMQKTHAV